METKIRELFSPLVQIIVGQNPPNALMTDAQLKAKIEREIESQASTYIKRLTDGHTALIVAINEVNDRTPGYINELIIRNLNQVGDLSEDEFSKLYAACDHLFMEERFKEASDALFFLANANINQAMLWLALGVAEYFQNKWKEALFAFNMAFSLNQYDLRSAVYAAHCFDEMGEKAKAKQIIEIILRDFDHEDIEDLGDLKKYWVSL